MFNFVWGTKKLYVVQNTSEAFAPIFVTNL